MKKDKEKEFNILELLQEKYEIKTAQDISFALKDLFKDTLQQMMNKEFDESMGYERYDNKTKNQIIGMGLLERM